MNQLLKAEFIRDEMRKILWFSPRQKGKSDLINRWLEQLKEMAFGRFKTLLSSEK